MPMVADILFPFFLYVNKFVCSFSLSLFLSGFLLFRSSPSILLLSVLLSILPFNNGQFGFPCLPILTYIGFCFLFLYITPLSFAVYFNPNLKYSFASCFFTFHSAFSFVLFLPRVFFLFLYLLAFTGFSFSLFSAPSFAFSFLPTFNLIFCSDLLTSLI